MNLINTDLLEESFLWSFVSNHFFLDLSVFHLPLTHSFYASTRVPTRPAFYLSVYCSITCVLLYNLPKIRISGPKIHFGGAEKTEGGVSRRSGQQAALSNGSALRAKAANALGKILEGSGKHILQVCPISGMMGVLMSAPACWHTGCSHRDFQSAALGLRTHDFGKTQLLWFCGSDI